MRTDIYSAYGNKPLLKTVDYGVGDIVKVISYGEVYPSYRDAYAVFDFDIEKKERFRYSDIIEGKRINMYRVVGFLLHEHSGMVGARDKDYTLVAITNGEEDLIIGTDGVEPIISYNRENVDKVDRVVVSKVTDAPKYCVSMKTHTSQGS